MTRKIQPELREWIEERVIADEDGCWNWQLSIVSGKQPQGRYLGQIIKVRRVIWEQQHDMQMPVNRFAVCRHGNPACTNPDHVTGVSRSAQQKGKPVPVVRRLAIANGCRGTRKLQLTDVEQIRASDEPASDLAQRHGISETYVQQIRTFQRWREYTSPFAGLGGRA